MSLKRRMQDLERCYPPVAPEARYNRWLASLSLEELDRHQELLRRWILGQPLTPEERAEMSSWPPSPRQPDPDMTEEDVRAEMIRYVENQMSHDYHEVMQRRLKEVLPRGHTPESWDRTWAEAQARAAEWSDLLRSLGGDPEKVLGRLLT